MTSYCPDKCCNEQWKGQTAVGIPIEKFLSANLKICAVDPRSIPLWSVIEYDNEFYLAVDTGGKIRGQIIDVLLPTHKETIQFGRKFNQTIIIRGVYESKDRLMLR